MSRGLSFGGSGHSSARTDIGDTNMPGGAVARPLVALLVMALAFTLSAAFARTAQAAPGGSITIEAYEDDGAPGISGAAIPNFKYLVNLDNTPDQATVANPNIVRPPMASHSPVVAVGNQSSSIVDADPDTGGVQNLDAGRYLITVQGNNPDPDGDPLTDDETPFDYKLWGQHVTLGGGDQVIKVELLKYPLPLGKLEISIFNDFAPVNAAPDAPELHGATTAGRGNMAGFHVVLEDNVGQVIVDYWGNPVCTRYDGIATPDSPPGTIIGSPGCYTNGDGEVTIRNLPPDRYHITVIPPTGSGWVQTSTFEGKPDIDFSVVTEGDDGFGAIGEALVENITLPTAFWFGFVQKCTFGDGADGCPTNDGPPPAGAVTIKGTARTWVQWPPFIDLVFGQPVRRPWFALSGGNDEQVYTARGKATDPPGYFEIANVPPGTYTLTVWDDPLDYIIRELTVNVPASGPPVIDLGDVGIARWFGWVSGHVFRDSGQDALGNVILGGAANNGIRDCMNAVLQLGCEEGIPALDLDIRHRDASVVSATFTDPSGYYEFSEEISKMFRFRILEVGFGRFQRTGHSLYDELKHNNPDGDQDGDSIKNSEDPDLAIALPVSPDLGGGLLLNQLTQEGRRSEVDFGKLEHPADDPTTPSVYEGGTGGITGIIFHATTRNELDARLQANEDYETGIPDTLMRLWGLGDDGLANTADDVLLNELNADTWSHPTTTNPGDSPPYTSSGCDVRDKNGLTVADSVPPVDDNCVEVAMLGSETKAGAFDGGYAFETTCATAAPVLASGDDDGDTIPNDRDKTPLAGTFTDDCSTALTPDDYVVQAVTPQFFQVVKEEDINVNDGDDLVPQLPPPACVGDNHIVDVKSVNGMAAPDNYAAIPGVAPASTPVDNPTFALGDLYVPTGGSPFEGQVMPLCDKKLVTMQDQQNPAADFFFFTQNGLEIPGRVFGLVSDDLHFETDPNSIWFGEERPLPNTPITIRDFKGRILTEIVSDGNGFYEVLLPSTQTANCPNPAGICPGTYQFTINDPLGSNANELPALENSNYNPNYIVARLNWDIWPGRMTPSDTPLDPISATTCALGGFGRRGEPDPAAVTPELFTISQPYLNLGDTATAITITGTAFGTSPGLVTLDGSPLTVDSWADDQIKVRLTGSITAGPKQLSITTAAPNPLEIWNGVTFHVLGGTYTPTLVHVSAPLIAGTPAIQPAIDAAGANTIVLVHPGTYRENVIMHQAVKLQGYGPGGIVGAAILDIAPDDPRRDVPGTVIDGKFFADPAVAAAWDTLLGGLSYDGPGPVPRGAGITVVADDGEFDADPAFKPAVDGFGITGGRGFGSGGIQVHAYGRSLQITNNFIEGNGGQLGGGGIALGTPNVGNNENDNIAILRNRFAGNGAIAKAGGVAIFDGADNYRFERNHLCANFSGEYGGGLSHFGRSPGGHIADNTVYMNEAFDEGGGIMIRQELPAFNTLGAGTGDVKIERNLIHSNLSNDDGGGIRVLGSHTDPIDIVNNIVVGNVATDVGGGIALDDAAVVRIVNNTVAYNTTSDTAEDNVPGANGAGLVSEAYSPLFAQAQFGPIPNCLVSDCFPNPVLFNNIFWGNEAFIFDPSAPEDADDGPPIITGPGLRAAGCIDFEVVNTTQPEFFGPRFSILSEPYPPAGTDPSNIVGNDCGDAGVGGENTNFNFPEFVRPHEFVLSLAAGRVIPSEVTVRLLEDPQPLGEDLLPGDYHLQPTSPAINTGTSGANLTTVSPSSVTVDGAGNAVVAGGAADLATNNGSFFSVRSNTALLAPKISSWFGTFTGVPQDISVLMAGGLVSYSGLNVVLGSCSQTVSVWNWVTSAWVVLNTSNVGLIETLIPNLTPLGNLEHFVSGGPLSGPGSVQVRIRCTRTGLLPHISSGDLLQLSYSTGFPAPLDDFDRQTRPIGAQWEMGADETAGAPAGPPENDQPPEVEIQGAAVGGAAVDGVQPADLAQLGGINPTTGRPQAKAPKVTALRATVRAQRVTFRAEARNCKPCKAQLRIRIKGRWKSHVMAGGPLGPRRKYTVVLSNLPRGSWTYYTTFTDLDSGRKTTSRRKTVTIR